MTTLTKRAQHVQIQTDAPIETWFHIGGRADRMATPNNAAELAECLRIDPNLRVLGDGANLLVDDDGVGELVVRLSSPAFTAWNFDDESVAGRVRVGAGANLPKLILESVRRGRSGLQGLGGIPATLGGALVMNAGGAFGQIADTVARVHALDRSGKPVTLDRDDIDFCYRHSGLESLILTEVELDLPEDDPEALRTRLKEVMQYKKASQPMREQSAGCAFKNPIMDRDMEGIGIRGERVSAGMLIDRAGGKGLRVGGASVSPQHANFIVTQPSATARDAIQLMHAVRTRVFDTFGLTLQDEVVVWSRTR